MKKKQKNQKVQKKEQGNKRKLLRYYLLVLGFALFYYILSGQSWFLEFIRPVFEGYAVMGSELLNIMGQETQAVGKEIQSSAFSLMIKVGCDGITPMILYAMAIMAFPIHIKFKWKGVLYGLLAIFLLNLFRIITLYFVGKHMSYEFFEFIHVDVWSVVFLVLTVFLWLLWMKHSVAHKYVASHITT